MSILRGTSVVREGEKMVCLNQNMVFRLFIFVSGDTDMWNCTAYGSLFIKPQQNKPRLMLSLMAMAWLRSSDIRNEASSWEESSGRTSCYCSCSFVASSCCLTASWASTCIFSSFSRVTDLSGSSFGLHSIMVGTSSMDSWPVVE